MRAVARNSTVPDLLSPYFLLGCLARPYYQSRGHPLMEGQFPYCTPSVRGGLLHMPHAHAHAGMNNAHAIIPKKISSAFLDGRLVCEIQNWSCTCQLYYHSTLILIVTLKYITCCGDNAIMQKQSTTYNTVSFHHHKTFFVRIHKSWKYVL